MSPRSFGIEGEIDELYRQDLSEFTAARNALAARLKARGDRDGAARVKALPKPSVSAWAVNQVWWQAPDALNDLFATSDRLRDVQSRRAGADAVRQEMRNRRESLAAVLSAAMQALSRGGASSTEPVRRRIATTLEALSSLPETRTRAGRLSEDLDPPGFGALAAVALSPEADVPPREIESPRREKQKPQPKPGARAAAPARATALVHDIRAARARAAVEKAAEALDDARRAATLAADAEEAAATRAAAVAERQDAARADLETAQRQLEEARRAVAEAQATADGLETEHERAERARGAATRTAQQAARQVQQAEKALATAKRAADGDDRPGHHARERRR